MTYAKGVIFCLTITVFALWHPDITQAVTFVTSPCPTSTDLYRAMSNEIDGRLHGTTASDSTKKVFSTYGDMTGGWVRSSTVWTASSTDIDWSGVSPMISSGLSATLITPRHFVTAFHASVPVGAVLLFVAPDNSVATRTVTAIQRIGSTDMDVGILNSSVPSNITHYPILSTTTLESYLRDGVGENDYSLPVVAFDNEEKALVKVITKANLYNAQSAQVAHTGASSGNRSSFDETLIGGDSAHPMFLMVGAKPVLIGTHTSSNGASNYSNYRNQVEQTIDALGGGQDLSTVSLSCFNAPIVLNSTQTFSTLAESASNGTTVGTVSVAYNIESSTPYYTFASGNSDSAFAISSGSGIVTVADSSKISVSNNFPRQLVIKVEETAPGGRASYATTTVSLQAFPRFTAGTFNFSLDENADSGTAIGTIGATDAESDPLTYSIFSGNGSGAFAINPSSGALTVADPDVLDYEVTPTFTLVIKTQESNTVDQLSATTSVTISLNNLSTLFDQLAYTFNLNEAATAGAAAGQVGATIIDEDNSSIYYSITAGNSAGLFAIDSTTGVITVVSPSTLNYDSTSSYSLTVGVSEDSLSSVLSTVPVTINLTTASRPTIGFTRGTTFTYEGETVSLPVALSSAYARDVTVSYTVTDGSATNADYTLSSGSLTIPAGSTSGTISAITLADAATESNQTFLLALSSPVRASLGFQSSHAVIIRDGSGPVAASSGGGGSSGGGHVSSAGSGGVVSLGAPVATAVSSAPVTSLPSVSLSRTLALGSTGSDVKLLQQLLNAKGFNIAFTGPGSTGNETAIFGNATLAAVKRFQCKLLSICGTGDDHGYGLVGPKTRYALWEP